MPEADHVTVNATAPANGMTPKRDMPRRGRRKPTKAAPPVLACGIDLGGECRAALSLCGESCAPGEGSGQAP